MSDSSSKSEYFSRFKSANQLLTVDWISSTSLPSLRGIVSGWTSIQRGRSKRPGWIFRPQVPGLSSNRGLTSKFAENIVFCFTSAHTHTLFVTGLFLLFVLILLCVFVWVDGTAHHSYEWLWLGGCDLVS